MKILTATMTMTGQTSIERKGVIFSGVGGLYVVRTDDEPSETVYARARGKFRLDGVTPTVGDRVTILPVSEDELTPDDRKLKRGGICVTHVIDEISERRNILIRPPLANLDLLFAVIPCASPEPDLLTADKLTVIAENCGIETVIIINKCDLAPERASELEKIYGSVGCTVFRVSASRGDGMDDLDRFIRGCGGRTGAFAGVSGAGKSTIMTSLFPGLSLKTGGLSRKTERGRHTTRTVELFPVATESGIFRLADTPGFSVIDFTRFDFFPYDELAGSFREFGDCLGKCRYTKCTHLKEEGCAVLEKLENGEIAPSRHESYVKIYNEMRSVPEWKRERKKD